LGCLRTIFNAELEAKNRLGVSVDVQLALEQDWLFVKRVVHRWPDVGSFEFDLTCVETRQFDFQLFGSEKPNCKTSQASR